MFVSGAALIHKCQAETPKTPQKPANTHSLFWMGVKTIFSKSLAWISRNTHQLGMQTACFQVSLVTIPIPIHIYALPESTTAYIWTVRLHTNRQLWVKKKVNASKSNLTGAKQKECFQWIILPRDGRGCECGGIRLCREGFIQDFISRNGRCLARSDTSGSETRVCV